MEADRESGPPLGRGATAAAPQEWQAGRVAASPTNDGRWRALPSLVKRTSAWPRMQMERETAVLRTGEREKNTG